MPEPTQEEVNKALHDATELVRTVGTDHDASEKAMKTFEEKYNQYCENQEAKNAGLYEDTVTLKGETVDLTDQLSELKGRFDDLEVEASRLKSTGPDETDPDLAAYNKALNGYLRNHNVAIDPEIVSKGLNVLANRAMPNGDEEAISAYVKSLEAGTPSQGGVWMQPQRLDRRIVRDFETSAMRKLATVSSTSSDSVELVVDDDEAGTGGWVGETAQRDETGTPGLKLLRIGIHEQFAEPVATQKQLDDAVFDVETWLQQHVERRVERDENTAFVTGDGNDKPKGILSYPDWTGGNYTSNAIERVAAGTAGAFTSDGLLALQGSLHERYQSNATFAMRRASYFQTLALKDTAGQFLFGTQFLKDGQSTLMLLGKPVEFMADVPAAANDALAVIYGDFREGYTIVDRTGFRVLIDAITKKGFVKFYTTKRVGGDVTSYDALKIGQTPT